ncbi:MAG: HAMP domain-containing protein [Planctomycetia bacterium]|nr:HAMP domain-containing protein [Planctomycetia bacterium]
MKSYKDFAINTKLTLLVLLAGGVALLMSCIAFVTNDMNMIRSSMVKQMSTLADVLGANSTAALSFDDPNTASELLASLQQQPAVEFACIYDASGHAFASYHRLRSVSPPLPMPAQHGYEFTDEGYLDVARPIDHAGQSIGTIYLHASMDELRDQMLRYVNIVAAVMIVSLGASILLSSRLQRVISVPILKLADAAERISVERDYAIRVTKSANDELGTLYDQFNAMLDQIQQGEAAVQQAHDELEIKIEQRTAQLSRANTELSREISERLRAELELEAVHQQLMTSARRAGMAEMATGVLHNVGNVLNSINVSATLASDRMRQSKVTDLIRATQMIESHAEDLGAFITSDPKGKQLPGFLSLLAAHLADERADVVKELELLSTKINHVKTIVSTQQSYAGVLGVIETVDIATTLDDALKLNSASFDRHQIAVARQYEDIPKVRLDKQKVLQILVNLVKNAKDAITDGPHQKERKLTLRTTLSGEKSLQIYIIDNGMGIPPENLTRIFSHGFTTKKKGHGFGLHSCANAASELGGSLVAKSDGPGKGATFILELPFEPAEVPA